MDADLLTATLLTVAATAAAWPHAQRRMALSRAKHRSLAGHARIARRLAALLPGYHHDDADFYTSDGAPPELQARRRAGFARLAGALNSRHAKTIALTAEARRSISDLQFTGAYRVPFPYSRYLREHLAIGGFWLRSSGVTLTDLDGQTFYDLTGSYGVNVFGNDFYKSCIAEGSTRVADLGPVLGSYHPVVAWNVEQLRRISGLDEVSFHMSGTEAVMQAVRLARYHTRRHHLVRFCGAYHGWWDDVQPGPGNPQPPGSTYTLADMTDRSLAVLRQHRDIACVLVNPLQALHPNAAAPADSALIDSSRCAGGTDRATYAAWLKRLRQVCTERGIVLIFDEVFMGFRLGAGGAQAYFGVPADLVTYGKTLGGGLPVGVVCGKAALMKRWREDRPADICFARGTFNAHPYVMGAMQVFLERLQGEPVQKIYATLDETWDRRAAWLNDRLATAGVPVRIAHLGSVWTVCYAQPGRYNWMLQFYLRAHGLALSWVGTGRLVFSLDYSEEAFVEVGHRFLAAALEMQADGWWFVPHPAGGNKGIRRRMMREMLAHRWQRR